jgi:hypothetical protein
MSNRNNAKGGSGDFGYLSPSERDSKPIKGLDNGVLKRYGSTDPAAGANYGTRANINFPGLVARGANSSREGFSAITPNGVQKQGSGCDYNSNYRWGDNSGTEGERWNKNRDFDGDLSGN